MRKIQKGFSSSQIIISGFAGLILLGSLLLMLPFATSSGKSPNFLDALFTATSSVCVTGLVVQDTATYWSGFGQAVIISLIQIGGMGVVTLAVAISTISGRKIGLKQRSTMQEAISAPQIGGIVKLTSFIIKMTVLVEVIGAVVLAFVFCPEFGFFKGVWYSLFHSVSAFCNAGFDLMGVKAHYSSLTGYACSFTINIIICLLIVVGGLGFLTWDDIRRNKLRFRRYKMQSRMIIIVTAILIILPAIYLFAFEFTSGSIGQRVLESVFQAVTPRTAGFNTADLNQMSETGQALTIVLMLIGGSPGSTAGGMKTTTIAVVFATAISVFKRKQNSEVLGRTIPSDTISNALTILILYVALFSFSGAVISRIEGLPLLKCMFETASAIGTVGLTLGITPGLSAVSRIILMGLMYIGRVGGLTIIFSAVSSDSFSSARLPQAKLTVG